MTEPQPGPAVQPTGAPPASGGQGGQGDPAGQYAGYLKGVPEQFHPQVLDGLKRADAHWQQQLQTVQSRYAPYDPIVTAHQPDELQAAVQLLGSLRADPAAAVAELQAALGLGEPQGQGAPQAGETFDDGTEAPQWFAPLQQQMQQQEELITLLAERFIEQQQETQAEAEASQLDEGLRSAFGEGYDGLDGQSWNFLLSLLETGQANTAQEAVAAYREFVGRLGGGQAPQGQAGPTAVVMPGGGGMPTNQVDPRTLDSNGRKEAALRILQAAGQQQQ